MKGVILASDAVTGGHPPTTITWKQLLSVYDKSIIC